jgi:Rps23 Pro-64 3,4-dihydroxylase Tpa1-like proline 4-hydroxylase
MLTELVRHVREQIERNTPSLTAEFARDRHPVESHFAVLDNVLPTADVKRIYAAFPPVSQMRLMSSFREQKYTSKALDKMHSLIHDAIFAFQAPEVIAAVAKIARFGGLTADPSLYAGGISAMIRGHFLNPHIDNSHEMTRTKYRRINVLFYVTPNWNPDGGGNLELWDPAVKHPTEIPSLFNRLVIMETNRRSWHSVNPVRQPSTRCCVSNYYFSSESSEDHDYFHVTSFSARPEQPLARLWTGTDNLVRNCLRRVARKGLGRRDIYERGKARKSA